VQGLNDLYTRFFGMAGACILRKESPEGIVCFISNYSWLDGLSFPLMRERFLAGFDTIRIDSLNGDKYRTGKQTPTGEPDPSAASTWQTMDREFGDAVGRDAVDGAAGEFGEVAMQTGDGWVVR